MTSFDQSALAVVIPTVGRPTLTAAVHSALAQEPTPHEVIIAVDGPSAEVVPDELTRLPEIRVIVTGGGQGPSAARMAGVRASAAPLVAFLDDDDRWLPGKIAAQLALYAAAAAKAAYPVIACRAYVDTGRPEKQLAPVRTLGDREPLASYMFDRRKLVENGFMMGSSTLLTSRALLDLEPLNSRLHLHEDWEWLLRVAARVDTTVAMHPAPLINYFAQPAEASASRPREGWRQSLEFAEQVGLPARTRGDFLLCVTAPMALAHGKRGDALRVVLHAVRTSRPGIHAWAVILAQMLVPARPLADLGRWMQRRQHRRQERTILGRES